MTSFLEEQIRTIFDQHKDKIEQISIIIPNRRAAVYIQKYLANCYKGAFFSPEILTIKEWVGQHISEKILSPTELLFVLYEVHKEIESEKAEDFEQFILWGKTILSDFDEIDRYMVESKEIFKNLKDIKELESWNLDVDELSPAQAQFQRIWDKLDDYYTKLELRLSLIGATYSGNAYRKFYDRLNEFKLGIRIYFLGFNAISKVEKMIMKTLIDQGRAEVKFDIDRFYFDKPSHEAGYFYRQVCKEWKTKPQARGNFNEYSKNIEIIETSQQVAQAKIAGALVQRFIENGEDQSDIAVVLADESQLIPLSLSLPSALKSVNITMGWPIKLSHLKGFLDIVFEFQFNFKKFNATGLYYKTLLSLLQHPYTHKILKNPRTIEEIQMEITSNNHIFVDQKLLSSIETDFSKLGMILVHWQEENKKKFVVFGQLIELLYETFKVQENQEIELEILYQFSKGIENFELILGDHEVPLSLQSFRSLFYQFWQSESLSFLGNPIDGLQVMGILETRTLDFKNLIVVGMNEGVLPKSTSFNSFVPRDLRIHLKMPIEEDRQAIFAHHFYRLLHRSSNIHFTYNSNSDGWGSGEKSRFLIQLENELDQSIHQLKSFSYTGENSSSDTTETIYRSTPAVQKRLDQLFESGLSPSALNKFINCPLDFYYRYILQFDEAKEIEENIESSTFGTKIHAVLEAIIRENFELQQDVFDPLAIDLLQKENKEKVIHERLEKAYLVDTEGKKFARSDLKYGVNKLSFDVSKRFISSFLDEQIKELKNSAEQIIPQFLEKPIQAKYILTIGEETKTIRLKGKVDRIDKKGNVFRILDYKSGKSDYTKLQLKTAQFTKDGMLALMHDDKRSYARQLMMYSLMFNQSFPDAAPFSAGVISMINISNWTQFVRQNGDEIMTNELLDTFKLALFKTIQELYDPGFEFSHNPDSRFCQHCQS